MARRRRITPEQHARMVQSMYEARALRAEEARERAATAPGRLAAILGSMPSVDLVAAVLLEVAEEAYQGEVVFTHMEDLTEETKEEWIESWLLSHFEDYASTEAQ